MNKPKLTPIQAFLKDLAKEETVRDDVKRFSITGEIMNVNTSNFREVNRLFLNETYANNLYTY